MNNKVAVSKALSRLTIKFLSTWDLKVPCVSNISGQLMISLYNQEKRLQVLIKWSPNGKMLLLCLLSCVLYLLPGFWCLLSFMLSSALYAVWCFLSSALLSGTWCLLSSMFCLLLWCLVPSVYQFLSSALLSAVWCFLSSMFCLLLWSLESRFWCLLSIMFCLLLWCLLSDVWCF